MIERVVAGDLTLRAYRTSDEARLRVLFADTETARWNTGPADGDVTAWWQNRNEWVSGDHVSWAVAATVDDRLLGSVSVHKIDHDQRDAEIGYLVLPAERGRGVARRAVTAAAGYAFGRLSLHRIELFHAVGNAASCGVARGAGFRLEGELRESYRYADGRFHDEHLHARLVSDPPPLR